MLGVIVLAFLMWGIGLFHFLTIIPVPGPASAVKTDAIVVLTGGAGRVREGLDLLEKKMAGKLFISGVDPGVDVQELLRVEVKSGELQCCIVLGHLASSTRGNAAETAAWISKEGYKSFRVVTASYHTPRSLLELRKMIPADVRIVAHPVFPEGFHTSDWRRWPETARIALLEYGKYLVAVFSWIWRWS